MAQELKTTHSLQAPSLRQPQAAEQIYSRYLNHTRRQEGTSSTSPASSSTLTDGSGVPLPSWSRAIATSTHTYNLRYSRVHSSNALSGNAGAGKASFYRRRASLDLFSQPSSLENTFIPTANAAQRRTSVDLAALGGFSTAPLQTAAPKATLDRRPLKPTGPSRTSVFSRGVSAVSDYRQPLETLCSEDEDNAVFPASAWNKETPSLQVYAKQLQDPKVGIPTKQSEFKGVCTRIFNGSDAAEWFMLSMDEVNTSDDAQLIGQKLIDMGLIASTQPEKVKFKVSSKDWYYFCRSSNYSRDSVQPKPADTQPRSADSQDKSNRRRGNTGTGNNKKKKPTTGRCSCTIL